MLHIDVVSLQVRDHALSGPMSLSVPPGNIHLLRGPNGCGKSLLLDVASGVVQLRGINVSISDRPLDGKSAYDRWRFGLRRMFQTPMLPPTVTVKEALTRAEDVGETPSVWRSQVADFLGACAIQAQSGLGALSFGQRRAVDLAFTLTSGVCHLLDEPFAGMRASAVPFAVELLRTTVKRGASVLVVDHSAESRPELFTTYHDWVAAVAAPSSPVDSQKPAAVPLLGHRNVGSPGSWSIRELTIGQQLVAVDLDIQLPAGTAVICEGGNGTGKSTFLRALAGVRQPWRGVQVQRETNFSSQVMLLSPQPPKLVDDISVLENLRFMLGRFGRPPTTAVDQAHEALDYLGLRRERLRHRAEVLSGGEAAIVALVGAVFSPCPVLLLDEPFESLSAAALPRALNVLIRALDAGKSAIVVTHDPALIHAAEPSSVLNLTNDDPASGLVVGTILRGKW
jgi:ABC-type multidrug transport system ATPase subunit